MTFQEWLAANAAAENAFVELDLPIPMDIRDAYVELVATEPGLPAAQCGPRAAAYAAFVAARPEYAALAVLTPAAEAIDTDDGPAAYALLTPPPAIRAAYRRRYC